MSFYLRRSNLDACVAAAIACLSAAPACAQGVGVSALGASGGLNIPSAFTLDEGLLAVSAGNEMDPKLGYFDNRRNYSVGFGLGYGLEAFGRLTNYTSPSAGPVLNGVRDLSANVKWQLPIDAPGVPKFALGAVDVSGSAAASFFRARYGVVSDEWGPLRWSLGYGRSQAKGQLRVLDGAFGGAELRVWGSRATVLAEHDGTVRHAGARYYMEPLSWLGDAQFVGTLQRSFGAADLAGRPADKTSVGMSLVMPLGASDGKFRPRAAVPAEPPAAAVAAGSAELPGAAAAPAASSPRAPALADSADGLLTLLAQLKRAGLDRVRVGSLGADVVVDYENQRYLRSELDALGLVLGLAANAAPPGVKRVHAVARKDGLAMFEASVSAAEYRDFLKSDEELSAVRGSLGFGHLEENDESRVSWLPGSGEAVNRLRFSFQPVLTHTVGTEYGLFDYALGLQMRTSAPLWRGAEVYVDWVKRLGTSENMKPGQIFAGQSVEEGLQALALQQSLWLGPRLFASGGLGRYEFNRFGVEGSAVYFLPWGEDTLHLEGSNTHSSESGEPRVRYAASAAYRWRLNSSTWVEAGLNGYRGRDTGPSLAVTRWFGDVGLNMFARRGGNNTFVGLALSFPLAPRQGMAAAPVQLMGTARYSDEFRTLLARGGNAANWLKPNAVRPVTLSFDAERAMLDSGRLTEEYLRENLLRMKDSYHEFSDVSVP
jgi:hypothetical protein